MFVRPTCSIGNGVEEAVYIQLGERMVGRSVLEGERRKNRQRQKERNKLSVWERV